MIHRKFTTLLSSVTLALLVVTSQTFAAGVHAVPDSALPGASVIQPGTNLYIALLVNEPVVAYDGDVAGYKATKPGKGAKVNPNSAHVKKYVGYLENNQDEALNRAGVDESKVLYRYRYAINAVAVELSEDEARALLKQKGVYKLMPNEISFPDTDNSPDFLGLSDPGGAWEKEYFGEGVIVGVIDTGIWPEHPSFADDGTYGPAPAGFVGTGCDFGDTDANPLDAPFDCNNKLLAAKAYRAGFDSLVPHEYNSARDSDGHGSHTASTAAGNAGVPASILGNDLGMVSGLAPRARISVYKTCWNDDGCSGVDLVAAIDEAVADGVDVINYSIGSSSFTVGPDDVSFLFASVAGVFVATSNGNDGPDAATTGSPASVPWLTSVGASTQDRTYRGSAFSSDGWEYFGASITASAAELPLVDSADAGSELCIPGDLDAGMVAGKIVLCRRGAIARVSKSEAVWIAGGAGMILYNASDSDTQNLDNHFVPSVHINNTDGMAIKAYIAGAGDPMAAITGGTYTVIPAPWMAAFSSRGPNLLSSDIIKPDVTAPGVNILAANTPTPYLGAPGQLFQAISGTSMSSPHVAGLFALIKQVHPDWSAAMAKSALMTTAYQDVMKEDGATPADFFDMGAGHVDPGDKANKGSVFQPGLVYDAGLFEYAAFTCGADLGIFSPGSCDFLEGIGVPSDASDLNLASIGIGELVGSQTVVRTVTSVAPGWRNFVPTVVAPPGYTVSVTPSMLRIKSGQSANYEVTITNVSAALEDWAFGSLTWSDETGHYDVYSPIAVRAFAFVAPAEINTTGTDGDVSFDVKFGYTGDYSAAAHGLEPANTQADTVDDDPSNDIDTALDTCDFGAPFPYPCTGITWHAVTVPAGTAYTRFSLFDAYTDGADDLDLYVWGPGGGFVGGSGSGTSAEEVNVLFPAPGIYEVAVHGWQTDGPDANYTLFDWSVSATPGGNLSLDNAPGAAVLGTTGTVEASWAGIAGGTKHLGAISHSDGGGVMSLTLIGVETD